MIELAVLPVLAWVRVAEFRLDVFLFVMDD